MKKITIVIAIICLIFVLAEQAQVNNWGNVKLKVCVLEGKYYPCGISHTAIEEINVIGNIVLIEATVTDDAGISWVKLYYKKHSASGYDCITQTPDSGIKTYDFKAEIPKTVVTSDGIDYYLEAYDGGATVTGWKSAASPQFIEVNQTITVKASPGADTEIIFNDANPEDGRTYVRIPRGAVSRETEITVKQITDLDNVPEGSGIAKSKLPVAVYDFSPDGIKFSKPLELEMLYFDLDSDGKVDDTETEEGNLRVFWWDGFDWRLVGGCVDVEKNVVKSKIMHFTLYAVFPAGPLNEKSYVPKERIITPVAVGSNDIAHFDGLNGIDARIDIYDISGHKIRTINEMPYEWDGTDEDGRIVESGVYIYQFRAEVKGEMKLISGVIAVAK